MDGDSQVKVTNLKLKLTLNGEKVVVKTIKLKLTTKEHEYFSIGMPQLTFRLQKSNKVNDLKVFDVKMLLNTSKVKHSVVSDFRTKRTIRDIDYQRYLAFNGSNSDGYMKNPLAKQKKFTVVLKFTTNDHRKRGTNYLYNFPWFAGCTGYNSNDGGFGIGVDNNNAYIWSRMGDGGEIT